MPKTKKVQSAGLVLINPENKFLLLFKKRTRVWEFPQGGIEGGENFQEALAREVKEETGIENFRIVKDFEIQTHYSFYREGCLVNKTVTYYLAQTREQIKLSEEHEKYQWCDFKEAKNLFFHANHKAVLKEVMKRLEQPLEFVD